MRIATWNINGVRARAEFIAIWLEDRQPDIVGFQELKAEDDGVAVLSKGPVELTQRGLPGREENGSRLITGVVEDISFTNVYCPNGKDVDHDDYQMKLHWFDALNEYCANELARQSDMIICGDFNIVAKAIDSHLGEKGDGSIFHTDAERDRLNALFDQGLHDIYRAKYPDSDAYSWWDYRAGGFQRNLGLRIDLILSTKSILERVQDVGFDRDFRKKKNDLTASDHAPVYIDIE